jgi:NADH:ubiquinone oxidoreductase subunit 2 (subunit N)
MMNNVNFIDIIDFIQFTVVFFIISLATSFVIIYVEKRMNNDTIKKKRKVQLIIELLGFIIMFSLTNLLIIYIGNKVPMLTSIFYKHNINRFLYERTIEAAVSVFHLMRVYDILDVRITQLLK